MRFEETSVTLDGETRTVAEWASIRGIPMNTVRSRRSRGMTWAQALSKEDKRERSYFFGRGVK